MTKLPLVEELLRWRQSAGRSIPNCSDADSATSVAVGSAMFRAAGVERDDPATEEPGLTLQRAVEQRLQQGLRLGDARREWSVDRRRPVTDFFQFTHLADLQRLIEEDLSGTLGVEIGRDYLLRPDVSVSVPGPSNVPYLHASIACQWTIRSDRVQNIRHEGLVLTRHRRGRLPHIVVVTVEPLPSRLAAVARGTGEIDCVYHLLFDELQEATAAVGTDLQRNVLNELVGQRRLAPFDRLVSDLML